MNQPALPTSLALNGGTLAAKTSEEGRMRRRKRYKVDRSRNHAIILWFQELAPFV